MWFFFILRPPLANSSGGPGDARLASAAGVSAFKNRIKNKKKKKNPRSWGRPGPLPHAPGPYGDGWKSRRAQNPAGRIWLAWKRTDSLPQCAFFPFLIFQLNFPCPGSSLGWVSARGHGCPMAKLFPRPSAFTELFSPPQGPSLFFPSKVHAGERRTTIPCSLFLPLRRARNTSRPAGYFSLFPPRQASARKLPHPWLAWRNNGGKSMKLKKGILSTPSSAPCPPGVDVP